LQILFSNYTILYLLPACRRFRRPILSRCRSWLGVISILGGLTWCTYWLHLKLYFVKKTSLKNLY